MRIRRAYGAITVLCWGNGVSALVIGSYDSCSVCLPKDLNLPHSGMGLWLAGLRVMTGWGRRWPPMGVLVPGYALPV